MSIKTFVVASFATLLLGCAGYKPPQTAQEVINETKILMIAALKQVAENVRTGVMTDAERVEAVERIEKHRADLKVAEDLLALGQVSEAQRQAMLVNRLVNELHKRVAAKARQGSYARQLHGFAYAHRWHRTGWPVFAAIPS